MSQENVEIVRRWLAAMSGYPDQATVEEFWDADADYYPVRKFPEARPCHGIDAVGRFVTAYLDAYSRYELTIRDVTAIGDDRVLVRGNLRAEGRGSGVNLESELYHCFWLRHGKPPGAWPDSGLVSPFGQFRARVRRGSAVCGGCFSFLAPLAVAEP
jgi:SnoaL-like domain